MENVTFESLLEHGHAEGAVMDVLTRTLSQIPGFR